MAAAQHGFATEPGMESFVLYDDVTLQITGVRVINTSGRAITFTLVRPGGLRSSVVVPSPTNRTINLALFGLFYTESLVRGFTLRTLPGFELGTS